MIRKILLLSAVFACSIFAFNVNAQILNALDFDGLDDYVMIPHDPALNPASEISIEAWINPNDITTNLYYEIYRKEDALDRHLFSFQLNGTILSFGISVNGVYSELDVPIQASDFEGRWSHIAATFDGTTKRVYHNGVEIGTESVSGAIGTSGTSNAYIGCRSGVSEMFSGNIDEFRLWSTNRTQAEILANMNTVIDPLTPGLIAYYRFDEQNPNTTLPDLTGNGHDGALINMDPATDWIESYAMVVPTNNAATDSTSTSIDISWSAPAIGVVENYYLEVATDAAFTSKIAAYDPYKDMGTNLTETVSGLSPETTYFYRVRAYKASTGDVGVYSETKSSSTKAIQVTFNYNDEEGVVAGGENVYIAGDFNAWTPTLMTETTPGVFSITLGLSAGTYGYKYVVNDGGDQWDWLNTNNRSITFIGDITQEDYRNVQTTWSYISFPATINVNTFKTTELIYGQVYIPNVTNPAGEGRSIKAQVGYGTDVDPANWLIWENMTFNVDVGNNDEFMGTLTPMSAGIYKYAARFDGNWGPNNPNKAWAYADLDGTPYSDAQAGVLTVTDVPTPGNALDFDNVSDYVNVPTNPMFETIEFTAEAWINSTAISSNSIVACFDLANADGWNLSLLDNKIIVNLCKTTGSWTLITSPVTNVNDGYWHHVAFTLDNSNHAELYLDGVSIYSGDGVILGAYQPPVLNPLLIGRSATNANTYFGGMIDEVRVWNLARTQAEILANMDTVINPASAGLIAYYRFDELPGQAILPDLTGNGNNGTLTGMDPATDWVESYAMVYPELGSSSVNNCTEITIDWTAHRSGIAESYYLDVATDRNFSTFVPGYGPKDMGTALTEIVTLPQAGKFYYRVRAYKASTGDVGAYIKIDSLSTDTEAPVADLAMLPDVIAECEVTSLTAPTATDVCMGTINGTHDAVLPIIAQGTTVVTWTYDDGNGNISTQTQNVVLSDLTNPVLADCPIDIEICMNMNPVTFTAPTATDNCDPSPVVSQIDGPASGSVFPVGTTIVTFQAEDAAGNTATCSFNVTVHPTYPIQPVLDLFISEYIEGSSNNKAIELYNPTSNTITLDNYSLHRFTNGSTIATVINLTGTINANSTFVIANNLSNAAILSVATTTSSNINHNGDDAYALINNVTGDTLDIFGRIGEDPGAAWIDGPATTVNMTLIRNSYIFEGVKSNPVAGFPTLGAEWTATINDDATNLGAHTMDPILPDVISDFQQICDGDSYIFGTQTLTVAGIYTETFSSMHGCDSTVTLTLAVNPVYIETDAAAICDGDTYSFGTQTLSIAGDYTETFISGNGCDSTVTLTLTVNPVYNLTDAVSICDGDSYSFGTQTLTLAGDYTETFSSVNGCDSTVTLTLTLNPLYNETDAASICDGDTYSFGTQTLSTAGDFTEIFTDVNGCDSTVTLTLTVNPVYNETDAASICDGESFIFGSQTLTVAGDYTETFTSVSGCDSTVTLTLTVNEVPVGAVSTINASCGSNDGSATVDVTGGTGTYTYQWDVNAGSVTTQTATSLGAGTYFVTIDDGNCSSVTSGNVNEDGAPVITVTADMETICEGGSTQIAASGADLYIWSPATGLDVTSGDVVNCSAVSTTVYTVEGTTAGCSAFETVTITVNPVFNTTDDAAICDGDAFTFGTQTLTMAGDYTETFISASGCDSTVTLTLTVNSVYNQIENEQICSDGFYTLPNDSVVITAGTYVSYLTSMSGCDSIITSNITVIDYPVVNLGVDTTICGSEPITLDAGTADVYSWSNGSSDQFVQVDSTTFGIGTYIIWVEASNGSCLTTDTISVVIDVCSGYELMAEKMGVNIYPNPSNGTFTVHITNSGERTEMTMFDVTGKEVLSVTKGSSTDFVHTFRFDEKPAGMYYLRITSGENTSVHKVIIR